MVAAGDLGPVADRVRRRSHDEGEPRDHLPGLVRAGPRRAAPRTGPLPAHRPGETPPPAPAGKHRPDPRHGDDQRTSRRGRGPGRARPLGRRPDHRQGLQVSGRHPRGADHPLRPAAAPARRPRRRGCRSGHATGHHRRCLASCSAPSPGTRARRWPTTPSSPSPPASRSTSATRTSPGSAARTRTPTGCSASTCPKAPTCQSTPPKSIARIARSLNNRPRKTLGYMKPSEKLAELIAHTG